MIALPDLQEKNFKNLNFFHHYFSSSLSVYLRKGWLWGMLSTLCLSFKGSFRCFWCMICYQNMDPTVLKCFLGRPLWNVVVMEKQTA